VCRAGFVHLIISPDYTHCATLKPSCVDSKTSQKMCMIDLNSYVRNQMNTNVYDRISYYATKLGT
jgi:hypothetical protein